MRGGLDRKRVGPRHGVTTWVAAVVFVAASAAVDGAQAAKKTAPKKAVPKKPAAKKPAPEKAAAEKPAAPKPAKQEGPSAKQLFADFLHFAKIGNFRIANESAAALLKHPDAQTKRKPRQTLLLDLSEEHAKSIETLLVILGGERLCDDAKLEAQLRENTRRVLENINEGRRINRSDPDQIKADIGALVGEPQQVLNATQRLQWSGEYAVPWMIAALRDPAQRGLHPRIVKALPKLGLQAVNPLVMALRVDDDVVKLRVADALGDIGYAQALPYLKLVVEDEQVGQNIRQAAQTAVGKLDPDNAAASKSAATLFYELANQYYGNHGSVRADSREPRANVWYWRNDWTEADPVPTDIFDEIMTMRCCEEALRRDPEHAGAEALWLAANFRRESQLGVADVTSEVPDEACEKDITRSKGRARAIYYARSAGPRFNHMVLARALDDLDAAVALGAIAALAETAGQSSLIGKEDRKQPLVEALTFGDAMVRIRAALALGRALPKTSFAGSQEVIPVLGHALSMTGQRNVLAVDPDPKNLNAIVGTLRDADCRVIGEATFDKALTRTGEEAPALDACFLASDMSKPDVRAALTTLRRRSGGKVLPVIIVAKRRHMSLAEEITREDPATGVVLASHAKDKRRLLAEWRAVNRRTGRQELDPGAALALALAAAETLRLIAASQSPVYDVSRAETALIEALQHEETDLRVLSAEGLAMIPSGAAQQAIAKQALDEANDEELRITMFEALAESGRHHGNKLDEAQLAALIKIVMTDKALSLRTAASQAFGALNVPGNRASEIIRAQYKG